MTSPWLAVRPLGDADFARVRQRAIFECHKWDPQVGDSCAIARQPLVMTRDAWAEVRSLAESLAIETQAAELEVLQRPELHARLGLPRSIRRALADVPQRGAAVGVARLMRFDFHFTEQGWRISEVNCDVPGGLNEASGFAALMREHYRWAAPVGDPATAYAQRLARCVASHGTVALIHATAYSDDQQMMLYIASRLEAEGLKAHLASPSHVRWIDGIAHLDAAWWKGPLDLIVRFFPAEWLANLPRATDWPRLISRSRTPISNPATAIALQSKRFPLIWDALSTPLPAWRALLPETRDPRDVPWRESNEWIVKPALGRVGEGVGMRDAVTAKDMRSITRAARWWPGAWIAQRRFHTVPIQIDGVNAFPCLGVYTLDGEVIGAYGRIGRVPLIDSRAADAAVLAA